MSRERRIRSWEDRLADLLRSIGYVGKPSRPIKVEKSVKDKNGIWRKTCTTPDMEIPLNKRNGNGVVFVELTNNLGNSPHKRAQRRVVAKAELKEQYVVISHEIIITGERIGDLGNRSRYLRKKLHLNQN